MPNFVQDYRNTDLNAPPLSGQLGSLLAVTDAVLANGYGLTGIPITSLTRTGAVATATMSAADVLKLQSGNILTVAGATGADASLYNVTAAITVASATTVTYPLAGTPTANAAGTITCDNLLRITGITRSGSTATATLLNANSTLRTGQWQVVGGANQAEYNGLQQITVIDSTHISFQVVGTPTTPATTATFFRYYKAGLGWAIPFTGPNVRVYRSQDATSNRLFCRIDDNGLVDAFDASMRGYVNMTDVNSGTGPFPTVAQAPSGVPIQKGPSPGNATPRGWTIFGDDKTWYAFISAVQYFSGNTTPHPYGFGHVNSYKGGDGGNTIIFGQTVFNMNPNLSSSNGLNAAAWGSTGPNVNTLMYLATTHNQMLPPPKVDTFTTCCPSGNSNTMIGSTTRTGIAYPNGPDGGLWVNPVYVNEYTSGVQTIRARMPGLYEHAHSTQPQGNGDTVTGVVGLPGATLVAQLILGAGGAANIFGGLHVDITGPW